MFMGSNKPTHYAACSRILGLFTCSFMFISNIWVFLQKFFFFYLKVWGHRFLALNFGSTWCDFKIFYEIILPQSSLKQYKKVCIHKKAPLHWFSLWNKARDFSPHCCCIATPPPPLLPWWQRRVDCMLWYALSRNLWMCRSIIAILYLIGLFSLPHLAEVSSPLIG